MSKPAAAKPKPAPKAQAKPKVKPAPTPPPKSKAKRPTDPESDANEKKDITLHGVGVGLTRDELELVDRLAGKHGVNRNAILRYGVLYLLRHEGKDIKLVVDRRQPVRRRLQMP